MNFRQDEFAQRVDLRRIGREFRGTAILAGVVAVLAIALLGTSVYLDARRAAGIDASVARLYAEALPGRPVPVDVEAALERAVREARARADTLGVYRGNLSALDLLTEISRLVPSDVEVVFEELSIDGQVIRIRGHTRSFEAVDRLRAELAKFETFGEIQVSEIKNEARTEGKSFSVTIGMAETGAA